MTDKDRKDKNREEEIKEAAAQIMSYKDLLVSTPKREINANHIGLDIGTSKVVLAEQSDKKMKFYSERNAFINVDYTRFTQDILQKNEIRHYKNGNSLIVYGHGAEIFADMMNSETRRPMRKGLLNPKESEAIEIIKEIIEDLLSNLSDNHGSKICFSIPGASKNAESDIIYHETVIRRLLNDKGFNTKSINEGLAVIFSELEEENFTGLGISVGGGMCNVCLAFLSVPVLTFSISKGGDYIDDAVSSVTGEVNTRVRRIKENDLDLTSKPRNEVEDALHIYYEDLILTLVKTLKDNISQTSKIPKFEKPIQIALSGGSVMPNGFKKRFEYFLKQEEFPLKVSEVKISSDPLNATSKGALLAASYED